MARSLLIDKGMTGPVFKKVFPFQLLAVVTLFFSLSACGDGTALSTSVTGGEIFYTNPMTDEGETGVSADDDSSTDDIFNDGGVGADGDNSVAGSSNYSVPSGDTTGIDIPVNIAKCETRPDDEEDEDDNSENDGSVYQVMMKSAAKRSKTPLTVPTAMTLKGASGTFPNRDGELSLVVLNLSTGKSVEEEIFDDGSFKAVTIVMESESDAVLIGAFDGETFVKSYAFVPRVSDDDDEPETCTVPPEEESRELAKGFVRF